MATYYWFEVTPVKEPPDEPLEIIPPKDMKVRLHRDKNGKVYGWMIDERK